MNKTFRWGIIGLGRIAHKFATGLQLVPNAQLYAVASREIGKAQTFAAEYGASHAFGSYEELLTIKDLDAIYVATPHSEHHANVLMCLRAGIPVLCEKAFAFNARQVREMIATARLENVFLMEAIWTRFLPATLKTLELIESGSIGDIKHLSADFGFLAPYNPEGRLFNKALAGGSLLDIGIYPLFISKLLLGNPQHIKAVASLTETGVDMACTMALSYENGATASLFSTLAARTDSTATIYGTKGKILMHSRFHEATAITLEIEGDEPQYIPCERLGDGYCYEAIHVQECLTNGLTQSPLLPLSFSLELIELMDEIRRQIGVVYEAD